MIRWFAHNGVAANLLMGIIVVGGLITLRGIKMEIFPELSAETIMIRVPYLGAAPQEVEEAICVRIEEKIEDIEGIKRITSNAFEGLGSILVEVERGYDSRKLLDDIKVRVDAIDTFPEEAEKPLIEELIIRSEVLAVAVTGPMNEKTLKRLAERVRDDISKIPGITQVDVVGTRPYEISIEVSEATLRRHGLSFDNVVGAVRASSLDLPGGSIKSQAGEILLRTKSQAYTGQEFERLVLLTRRDGTRLTLGDVARVVDGFEDNDQFMRYEGNPAALVRVYRVGEQNPLEISDSVLAYVEEAKGNFPDGVKLEVNRDSSFYLEGRLFMLVENGLIGLILVFLVLTLFLRPSLAIFISLGIPVSFLGTILLMPVMGMSINLISLFGFILVLGIVVDDAIIVGESVFTRFQRDGPGVEAAIAGTKMVSVPVTFAVLTTVVAFAPLLILPGWFGKLFGVIPLIVIPTLLFSLLESKLVLPYHLSLCKVGARKREGMNILSRAQRKVADSLEWFIEAVYRPVLRWAITRRYLTLACFFGVLVISVGSLVGGWVRFSFFPDVESDYIIASLIMPEGTPVELTSDVAKILEDGLQRVREVAREDEGQVIVKNVVTTVGSQPIGMGPMPVNTAAGSANVAQMVVELSPSEMRRLNASEITDRWRREVGVIPGIKELSFLDTAAGSPGSPIEIRLAGRDYGTLTAAAANLKSRLGEFAGVYDVRDSFSGGKREMRLEITPSAEALGLTQADLARQVRQAFYGEEVQRIQRARDEVRVMVRYPKEERRSLGNLEEMRIRTPDGAEVPFRSVARAVLGRGYATITRVDRQRTVTVKADADKARADIESIKETLSTEIIPGLGERYSDVSFSFEGESRDQEESLATLKKGFVLALFVIYALMAVPFRSYVQPLIVVAVIPFGLIGALIGHLIMFKPLSMISVSGLVALTGIVVNDSLVLVDYVNRLYRGGTPVLEAVWEAATVRFRPIILTSLTTFAGLVPILLERSLQAQILIPMAISIAFGVLFATFITLILVPVCYLILEDIIDAVHRVPRWGRDAFFRIKEAPEKLSSESAVPPDLH